MPWVNGLDVTGRARFLWIVDFGVGWAEEAATRYEAPFECVRERVKPERDHNKREVYRRLWWQHMEARSRYTPTTCFETFARGRGARGPDESTVESGRPRVRRLVFRRRSSEGQESEDDLPVGPNPAAHALYELELDQGLDVPADGLGGLGGVGLGQAGRQFGNLGGVHPVPEGAQVQGEVSLPRVAGAGPVLELVVHEVLPDHVPLLVPDLEGGTSSLPSTARRTSSSDRVLPSMAVVAATPLAR